jgi:hypothetical protein
LPLFDLVELPFCKVVCIGKWNESAHRYYLAYRTLGTFRHTIGLPVTDEFATFSSPIFFCAPALLGKIYNTGISLGHQRGPDMDLDSGWPPVCVGTSGLSAELPDQWESQLLETIKKAGEQGSMGDGEKEFEVQRTLVGECEVFATNAPLLTKQLRRICQLSSQPISLAFSTGNRIIRTQKGQPISVKMASEEVLSRIIAQFR